MTGGPIPRLHVVTDPATVAVPGFLERAGRVLEAGGPSLAFHLRVPGASGRFLHQRARALLAPAEAAGARLLVNDRLDVALTAKAHGAQVGARSLSPADARKVLGPQRLLGASVHDAEAARQAAEDGADFLLVGTIYPSASHPERRGAGPERIRHVADRLCPVLAIGGVTPGRVPEVLEAGAWGVAVVQAVWAAPDPAEAVEELVAAVDRAAPANGEES